MSRLAWMEVLRCGALQNGDDDAMGELGKTRFTLLGRERGDWGMWQMGIS
jgi:hypothetical protein